MTLLWHRVSPQRGGIQRIAPSLPGRVRLATGRVRRKSALCAAASATPGRGSPPRPRSAPPRGSDEGTGNASSRLPAWPERIPAEAAGRRCWCWHRTIGDRNAPASIRAKGSGMWIAGTESSSKRAPTPRRTEHVHRLPHQRGRLLTPGGRWPPSPQRHRSGTPRSPDGP